MKLKVCGMKYNTGDVAVLEPDYLGFIFYDKSPRNFEGNFPELSGSIKKVGVFVDADINEIENKIKRYGLDVVQLHGKESPNYCERLKKSGVEIIKVFSIKGAFDFTILEAYEEMCDYYLFDTKGKSPGGNGFVFDWSVLKNYPSTKSYFLSGGIGMDEVERLKDFLKSKAGTYCYALDVNSKFEIEPGLKNIKELKKFKSLV